MAAEDNSSAHSNAYRAVCHQCSRQTDQAPGVIGSGTINGGLAKFGDMNFGREVLLCLILNKYEYEILTNYLDEKNLTVKDVLEACMVKLEQGEYSLQLPGEEHDQARYNITDQARYNITRQTLLCFDCGLRNFKLLAYQYRADIPPDQLPAEVTARSNCYWGKNCRTQHNKPAHAMRFNHICEQTRT